MKANIASKHVIPFQGAILEVKAIAPVSILELDDDEEIVSIIATPTTHFRKKIYGCEQILIQPVDKKTFYEVNLIPSVIDLDKTPIMVPVEMPPLNVADTKRQLMGLLEQERRAQHKPTAEEFFDLNMDDGLEDIFPAGMTVHEAQAEALRQINNPFRGLTNEELDKTHQEAPETESEAKNGEESVKTEPETSQAKTEDK